MTEASPPDVVFEGNSRHTIKSFPRDVRSHLGADLDRVQNGEKPLDFCPMGAVLPGVAGLRDEDRDFLCRVLYVKLEGVVHVLHCFTKKTNETPSKEINTARARLSALKQRLLERKKKKR